MNWDTALALLLDRFPTLKDPTRSYVEEWTRDGDDESLPGPYNIVGDVLMPGLIEPLLNADLEDMKNLDTLFELIELMVSEGDQEVQTLVGFGICERIGDSAAWLSRARSHMGRLTLALSETVERHLGRSQ